MQVRLLDILADPNTKTWPLELHVFTKEEKEVREVTPYKETQRYCRFYCARKKQFLVKQENGEEVQRPMEEIEKIVSIEECKECTKEEIIEGVILSKRDENNIQWFPIVDSIPIMYPDELRDEKINKMFLQKWGEKMKELGVLTD